ncbi:hypothetical protein, partial [Sphingopyxis sp.]|uniref:hypothetical protein n=2 Tax=unclassified Sphingopyxis TaxID=2614943 RepID=UPI0025EF2B79
SRLKCANSTITMNPVATSDAAFRGGACPTPEYTIAYTGNYTTSADANLHISFNQFASSMLMRGYWHAQSPCKRT